MQESGGVEADLRTAEQDERLRGHTAQSLGQFPHELYIPEIAGEGDDGRAVFIDRLPEGLELVVDGQLQDGGLPVPAPQIGGQGANRQRGVDKLCVEGYEKRFSHRGISSAVWCFEHVFSRRNAVGTEPLPPSPFNLTARRGEGGIPSNPAGKKRPSGVLSAASTGFHMF